MHRVIHGILYGISLLPDRVVYGIGDLLFLFLYHVTGYRKGVVMANLAIAFPEKDERERKEIAGRFYRNLTESMAEAILLLSAGRGKIARMFRPTESAAALLEAAYERKKPFQLHFMHNFNVEVTNLGLSVLLRIPFLVIYMPLSSPAFDAVILRLRRRFGAEMLPATRFTAAYLGYLKRHPDSAYAIAFVGDQSPGVPGTAWWADFFSRRTPFVTGPEKAARQKGLPVYFVHYYRVARGEYRFDLHAATGDASQLPEGALTRAYVRYVEACIRARPDNYLWSHRRWKHAYDERYAGRLLDRDDAVS